MGGIMHHYLYKITNKINHRFYIGAHSTKDLNDGYMGSGKSLKLAIQKYGIENFSKEIIEVFHSAKEMYAREECVVNNLLVENKKSYNMKIGGKGGWESHRQETKKILSEKRKSFYENGGEHPKGMLGKKHKEETKKHVSEVMKEKGSMIGKKGLEHPAGGTKWYNNGKKHLRTDEHPGDGWIEGRIFKERKKRK